MVIIAYFLHEKREGRDAKTIYLIYNLTVAVHESIIVAGYFRCFSVAIGDSAAHLVSEESGAQGKDVFYEAYRDVNAGTRSGLCGISSRLH